jgi:hypothetical protein
VPACTSLLYAGSFFRITLPVSEPIAQTNVGANAVMQWAGPLPVSSRITWNKTLLKHDALKAMITKVPYGRILLDLVYFFTHFLRMSLH